jgi:signal transduction histidine kinase
MARELSQNDRLKNDFIASVSHELRTPLTSIKGWTETVSGISDPNDPNFRRGVQIIAGETDRLYDMVEELLDFSSMQHGMNLQPEWLDLAAEVEEAVLLSEQRVTLLDVAIDYEAPELPVPVMADKNRLRQVFINVLDNAVKYSHPHDQIEVQVTTENGEAVVAIQDEGVGIRQEDLKNVKKRFYKGKAAVRGSGIGLAVVDEIMRAHGGSLDIESEGGEGTLVTLRIPLAATASLLPQAKFQPQSDNGNGAAN